MKRKERKKKEGRKIEKKKRKSKSLSAWAIGLCLPSRLVKWPSQKKMSYSPPPPFLPQTKHGSFRLLGHQGGGKKQKTKEKKEDTFWFDKNDQCNYFSEVIFQGWGLLAHQGVAKKKQEEFMFCSEKDDKCHFFFCSFFFWSDCLRLRFIQFYDKPFSFLKKKNETDGYRSTIHWSQPCPSMYHLLPQSSKNHQ